jgi:hypothetical protein
MAEWSKEVLERAAAGIPSHSFISDAAWADANASQRERRYTLVRAGLDAADVVPREEHERVLEDKA